MHACIHVVRPGCCVPHAEKEPSLHDLVERWLERTPFLAIGTFNWWQHYQTAVNTMLDEDERVIMANDAISPDLKEQQVCG